jgi:uncharacterized protein YbaR (Trm112 family)
MHVDLIDALRCPAAHEESWLVATIERWSGRHIESGSLGCPVCRAVYPIEHGTACFAGPPLPDDATAGAGRGDHAGDDQATLRLAAQLDLTDPGGIVLLGGDYARHVAGLRAVAAARYVAVNAEPDAPGSETSALRVADRLPFAEGTVRAAAFDAGTAPLLAGAARALQPGGRLVGPAGRAVPDQLRELVRDDTEWVAIREVRQGAGPVPIGRRRPGE